MKQTNEYCVTLCVYILMLQRTPNCGRCCHLRTDRLTSIINSVASKLNAPIVCFHFKHSRDSRLHTRIEFKTFFYGNFLTSAIEIITTYLELNLIGVWWFNCTLAGVLANVAGVVARKLSVVVLSLDLCGLTDRWRRKRCGKK